MKTIRKSNQKVLKKVKGAHLIEYGLVASLVGIASVTALGALGTKLTAMFNFITSTLKVAAS